MVRKALIVVAVLAFALAACAGKKSTTAAGGQAPSCSKQDLNLVKPSQLTIGTDNPAYPPYFAGGETKANDDWRFNDPYTGEGFEAAVAYEVAKRMGFANPQVAWVVAPFGQTFKPGPKDYDFAIEQIEYSDKRAQAVDFSDSYYGVDQALVAVKGTPISRATNVADLKNYALASEIGTTSYDYIVNTIQPTKEAGAYDKLTDAVAAINAGQIDGLVVDYPTALYMADPFVQQVKNSTVVGQFETAESGGYFALAFEKGNPLVACVNKALDEMKADGTLDEIEQVWLSEKTNVGKVPVLS
ncbi:MAG: ABC transporter substrate-binding protein [Actinomycetota bacterium]